MGFVHLKGIASGPAIASGSASTIFQLPALLPNQFRPVKTQRLLVVTGAGGALLQILPSGEVQLYALYGALPATWVDLSGVIFDSQAVTTLPSGPRGAQGPAGTGGVVSAADYSAQTSIAVTGLDGNVDYAYEVVIMGSVSVATAAARNVTARPNNLATNTQGFATGAYGNNTVTGENVQAANAGVIVGRFSQVAGSLFSRFSVEGRIPATQRRHIVGNFSIHGSDGTSTNYACGGTWGDTANLTSLTIDFGGLSFTGRVVVKKLVT